MPPDVPHPSTDDLAGEKAARFYVPALDGLRTLAFLMVWVHHAKWLGKPYPGPPLTWKGAIVQAGAYGVPIFFVLSAFLITRLLLVERKRTGRIDLRAYYVRRTLRIWPLYFLIVGLAVLQWARRGPVPISWVLPFATFTANWTFTGDHESLAMPLWSVSVEEQFYVVWPFVLARASAKSLKAVCAAMVAIALVVRFRSAQTVGGPWGLWTSTLNYLDALAFGTLLALYYDRLPKPSPRVWYALFGACLFALVAQARSFPIHFRTVPFGVVPAMSFTIVTLVSTAIAALTVVSKRTPLEHPWMVGLGRLSYGMYCYHIMVLTVMPQGIPFRSISALVATVALAWVSYHLYEKRFLRLKHRFERVPSRPD